MSEKKFQNAADLEAWLRGKDVDTEMAAAACQKLFDGGYCFPSALIGITFEEMTSYEIRAPVARYISNKLQESQQKHGEISRFSNGFDLFFFVINNQSHHVAFLDAILT